MSGALGGVLAGTCPAGLGASTPAPSPASALAPAALIAKAIADAEGAGWVHEVGHGAAAGHVFSAVNDIGTFEGRQVIDDDAARAEVIQIGQQAYIRGNAAAISGYFGLTKNDPQQLANTWISVVPSDGGEYTTVIAAVTLKSDFSQESISGPLTEGPVVHVRGLRCIPIVGHVSQPSVGTATATLYVTDDASPLPIEYKAGNNKASSTTIWTGWGKPVPLTSPTDAVPFSSLAG